MPYIGLRDWWRKGNAKVVFQDWGSYSINDMSAITSVFFSDGPDDYARDADVINWLKIGDTTIDPEVRKENYRKAIHRITERAYWLPMFSYVRNYAYSENLNFRAYRDEILRYYAYDWK
jgi:peptide/nickel transport system substrate-binding protein